MAQTDSGKYFHFLQRQSNQSHFRFPCATVTKFQSILTSYVVQYKYDIIHSLIVNFNPEHEFIHQSSVKNGRRRQPSQFT